jgi:hypothetical protein
MKINPLLLFTRIVLTKSLLTLTLAAVTPSPSIAVKKSLSLLRAIGLSAGLVASAAMMPSVHAATSATITATGTIPAACDVAGTEITMTKINAKELSGTSTAIPYTLQSGTQISLSRPTLAAPSGYGGLGRVYVRKNNVIIVAANSDSNLDTHYTATQGTESGNFTYEANVMGGMLDVNLIPGNYTISTTLTCISQ